MAKLSKEEVEQIIERDLPGYRIANESLNRVAEERRGGFRDSPDSSTSRSKSDAASPDLNKLREKLRNKRVADTGLSEESASSGIDYDSISNGFGNTRAASDANETDDAADDMIVAVKPKSSDNPFDAGYKTKAVVISGRSKKVIGRQG